MSLFAVIFAILVLTLFWGGFGVMLFYTLKLKTRGDNAPEGSSHEDSRDKS